MTNPFDNTELETTHSEAVEAEDLDVDMPSGESTDADELDTVETPATAKASTTKEPKAPARPPVPEGYITPVEGAKRLTTHLEKRGASNKAGLINKDNPVTSQMVYSYIKNSQKQGSKDRLETYNEGGRDNLVIEQELLDWWDRKDKRVEERAANAKAKLEKQAATAAEKAAKAATPAAETAEVTAPQGEVTEAE